jgi:putative membrane protein
MDKQITDAPSRTSNQAADRTKMAVFRTHLALERTTLAWIRTTLTMASFGFGMVAFLRSLRQANPNPESIRLHEAGIHFGVGLIVFGIAATVLAGLAHWFTLRRLRRNETPVLPRWPLSITVGMLLALAGLWGLWSLLAR